MSKLAILLMFGYWLCTGCNPADSNVNYKLSDDALAHLMLDIQLSELSLNELSVGKRDTLRDLYWLRFKEIYKMTEPELKGEVEKLESDPEKMKLIMEKVRMLSDSIQ